MFFIGRDWETIRIEAKMKEAKYREILDEKLFQSLRLGQRFTF